MTNPETVSSKLDDPSKGFWSVFGFAFVYFLGAAAFTGLLIATITNIWRARADKFRRGTVKYRFKEHIVFIGYNSLIAGMIQKICEKEDVRIVVGVENNASTICDKIKNRLFNDYRNRVVVLQADGCNMKDLERLRVSYAKDIYIIGEHDDAYNLKCYRTIYEVFLCEKSPKAKMPQCYVNLHSQATLTLFRTYASAGDLGIDFTSFHSFSFYDEWARTMIQNEWESNESIQDHFIIAGMTEMGLALARKVALLCHNPNDNKPTRITFIDDEACKKSKLFIIQHQDFFDNCLYRIRSKNGDQIHRPKYEKAILDIEFAFIDGDLTDDMVRQNISYSRFFQQNTTIALCYDDPQQNLIMGLNLPNIVYDNKSGASVWIYQPTFGDLGNYLKNSWYQKVVTFGMLGEDLDIKNEENIRKAKLLNHFFIYYNNNSEKEGKEKEINYSDDDLIQKEWESINVYKRWECIRRAEFISLCENKRQSNCGISQLFKLERKRNTTDNLLFDNEESYTLRGIIPEYFKALQKDISSKNYQLNKTNNDQH